MNWDHEEKFETCRKIEKWHAIEEVGPSSKSATLSQNWDAFEKLGPFRKVRPC